MRSDDKLSEEVRKSEDWTSDPVSGRANTEVVRFSAPDEERVRMSLSGKERNYLFLNDAAGSFLDVSGVSGTDSEKDGRSFAILDMDRDGWQDMVLANANTPVLQMFRNQLGDSSGNGGNIIAVRFVGGNRTASPSESMSNRDGVGVKVKVDLGGGSLLRESFAGEGLAAQNSGTMMIGIGEREGVELLEIIWPSGKVQRIAEAKAGELITVHEDVAEADGETGVVRERYLPEGGKSRAFDDQ
ncbi:MAG: CRTAC1 family protein, partial [Verrucomicrobiota bacterium]